MIEIVSLAYQPSPSVHEEPYHYTRVAIQTANLVVGHGIEGDEKGGKHPERHLNIMSYETVQALAAEGYKTGIGELGEQIVLKGSDLVSLPVGTRLRLGEQAVIEITKARTGCDWFQQIQGFPKANTVGRLGIMASVVEGGLIRVGDTVTVLETVMA